MCFPKYKTGKEKMCTYEEAMKANGSKWKQMAVGEFEKKVKNAN